MAFSPEETRYISEQNNSDGQWLDTIVFGLGSAAIAATIFFIAVLATVVTAEGANEISFAALSISQQQDINP